MAKLNLRLIIGDLSEVVPCNLCRGNQIQTVAQLSRFNIPLNTVICKDCGLIYHNPRMGPEAFTRFYEHDYRRLIEAKAQPVDALFGQQVKHGYRIVDWVGADFGDRVQVLDIGSGPGGQMWAFREARAAEVIGVEPAVEHAQWGRDVQGLDIRTGMFEEMGFNKDTFDLVVISQTLNHLLDPYGTLQRVRSILKPSGRIFVETIDFVYWTRHAPLTMTTTIDHPYMFCQGTLRAMLEKAGFEILKWEADADLAATRPSVPGQPNLHIRALAQKGSVPETVRYPDYREILRSISANQRVYRERQIIRWGCMRVDRAKGLTRQILGERAWRTMKSLGSLGRKS